MKSYPEIIFYIAKNKKEFEKFLQTELSSPTFMLPNGDIGFKNSNPPIAGKWKKLPDGRYKYYMPAINSNVVEFFDPNKRG